MDNEAGDDLPLIHAYRTIIQEYLDPLQPAQRTAVTRPQIGKNECAGLIDDLRNQKIDNERGTAQQVQYAAIETVFRENFYELLARIDIKDPAFVQVWNLLDVVAVLSDEELCESGLIFWLIEELLDSQTIDGCRRVFDYLESRRERITSKHFKQKQLIILRCCNELLRRLSRAEDIVFCGRVFIFLFQSFPLGDKSSVNLRGEYHVENVTTFDHLSQKSEDAIKPMELDVPNEPADSASNAATPSASDHLSTQATAKGAVKGSTEDQKEPEMDLDILYPIFWGLQAFFSSPTRLFDSQDLETFKTGIEATMSCFRKMSSTGATSTRQDDPKRGIKRKRSENESGSTSTFNPKYLTNRDLFDLEVHDIAFRRHILVQALILLDFLLALTPAAKAKSAELTNKSVLYPYVLSDANADWASSTRASIASYLQQGNGNEGKFYYRMVDTVLSRDKNWVRWKAENCPPIDRPSIEVAQYLGAQRNLQKICNKPPPPPPPGVGDLDFLSKSTQIERLKDPSRYALPSMESFYRGIQNDELDAEMGTPEEIQAARDAKERRLWRALRASKNRFSLCEKIENGKNLKALVGQEKDGEEVEPSEAASGMDAPGDA